MVIWPATTGPEEDPWKAEAFLATSQEGLIDNTGIIFNQTMALGHLDSEEFEQ